LFLFAKLILNLIISKNGITNSILEAKMELAAPNMPLINFVSQIYQSIDLVS
jgi:hypothetical protein